MLGGSGEFVCRLPPHCPPPPIIELDLLGPAAQPIERNSRDPEIEIPFIFSDLWAQRPLQMVLLQMVLLRSAALVTILKQDPLIRDPEKQPWKWEKLSFTRLLLRPLVDFFHKALLMMKSKEFLYPQSMYIFDYSAINISYRMNCLSVIYLTLVRLVSVLWLLFGLHHSQRRMGWIDHSLIKDCFFPKIIPLFE